MAKNAYVRIQSQQTIQVTCGLQNIDVTNPDAHVADRLKISPSWPRCSVVIKQGVGLYPSEIVEWPTVQALAKDEIITIGQFVDETTDPKEVEVKENLINELQANNIIEEEKKEEVKPKLSDIAGE